MPNDLKLQLPEVVVPGQRLGRMIEHDPRSLRYAVQPAGVAQTKVWERITPILDQGDLGSCTGNATVGALGTAGLFEHLTTEQQAALDEAQAVKVYSLATSLDEFDGSYPPEDSGSSGLGAAKAAQQLGLISGYQHITSIAAAQTAILAGPFIVGTNWMSGMDNPGASGLVHATGSNRGGHEYECYGYDANHDMWLFCNSWGEGWGDEGRFMYSGADFTKLLRAQGDATTFVPITAPAPTPTPEPTPDPTPTPPPTADPFPAAQYARFRQHPYSLSARHDFFEATDAWLLSQ